MIFTSIFLTTMLIWNLSPCKGLDQVQITNFERKNHEKGFPSYENALQQKRAPSESSTSGGKLKDVKRIISKFLSKLKKQKRGRRSPEKTGQRHGKSSSTKQGPQKEGDVKWHPWTNWSTCSVTCGKGRVIRWRHCKANCNELETEMEEKSCQLPACEHKLFGVIKLQ